MIYNVGGFDKNVAREIFKLEFEARDWISDWISEIIAKFLYR